MAKKAARKGDFIVTELQHSYAVVHGGSTRSRVWVPGVVVKTDREGTVKQFAQPPSLGKLTPIGTVQVLPQEQIPGGNAVALYEAVRLECGEDYPEFATIEEARRVIQKAMTRLRLPNRKRGRVLRRRVVAAKRRRSARQAGSRRNPMPKGKAFKSGGFKETLTVIRAGGFVEQMKYEDANDRQRYFHDFEDLGAQLFLCDSVAFGKCILVVSSDEKPLWEPA